MSAPLAEQNDAISQLPQLYDLFKKFKSKLFRRTSSGPSRGFLLDLANLFDEKEIIKGNIEIIKRELRNADSQELKEKLEKELKDEKKMMKLYKKKIEQYKLDIEKVKNEMRKLKDKIKNFESKLSGDDLDEMRGRFGITEITFHIPESEGLNERMSTDVNPDNTLLADEDLDMSMTQTNVNSMDPEDYVDFMLGQSGGKRKTMKRKGSKKHGKKHAKKSMKAKKHSKKHGKKSMKGKKGKKYGGVRKTMKRKMGKK